MPTLTLTRMTIMTIMGMMTFRTTIMMMTKEI
jgi:hypothetical protein